MYKISDSILKAMITTLKRKLNLLKTNVSKKTSSVTFLWNLPSFLTILTVEFEHIFVCSGNILSIKVDFGHFKHL